ncbi:MAG: adenosylcobinamide-phosphate synthase CbiB [Marinovum sp.]|nr:adenosylcobinamide-phosphate synthase CbiB [Marinovum sp.]
MMFAAAMLVGMLIDAVIGWPNWLFQRIGHPVTWVGDLISKLELLWNTGSAQKRRISGGILVVFICLLAAGPTWVLQSLLPSSLISAVILGVLAWPLIASRSMYTHVQDVQSPLDAGDILQARIAVSMIVGRDPNQLDHAGVARAALESLAENASDGVFAPLFWGVIAGLPGIAVYKAINTMDSMIGHRNARYEDFGKVAARLDDVMNLAPARLTGLLFALVSGAFGEAVDAMRRDAGLHRSPNAGWPEAAMAAALNVRLSGPRVYGDTVSDEPWVFADGEEARAETIASGLALYLRAVFVCALGLLALAVI